MIRPDRTVPRVRLVIALTLTALIGAADSATAQPSGDSPAQPPSETSDPRETADADDEPEPSSPAPTPEADDERLQEQIRQIYHEIDPLRSIDVSVTAGVVRLSGKVDEPSDREMAATVANEFERTLYVQNNIEVSTQVSERISPALERAVEKLREFVGYLPLFGVALVVLALFWVLAWGITKLNVPGARFAERPFLQNIVRQVVALIVFLTGVLFVLDLFDVTSLVGAVLGTAGLAGLALGFAFRDIAENYLASIILGVQQPFHKNDLIRVGEFEGKVVRMTPRETVLMTMSGNHVRVPNSTVFKSPTYNFSRNPLRRFDFTVGIGVDEDVGDAQKFGVRSLRTTEGVAAEPEPFAHVDELGDSTVVLSFYGWVDQADYDWQRVRSESVRRVKNALDAAGVEMPEPTYRVWTAALERSEDAEEKRQRAAEDLDEPGMEVEASPDIEEQIEEDRAHSEETDLLQD